MNIDVREYLRINPISVHELTLSDDGNDCFLLFPQTGEACEDAYRVVTQSQLILALYRTVFGDLLDYSTVPPSIRPATETPATIPDTQFRNYAKHSAAQESMDIFDARISSLMEEMDGVATALRRKGTLSYSGAVELQSNRTRRMAWSVDPVVGVGVETPMYAGMEYAHGQIWCKAEGSDIPTTGGSDDCIVGDEPLLHGHGDAQAQSLTGGLACGFGGGELLGDFTVGSRELVTQGPGYGPNVSDPIAISPRGDTEGELTYPLMGQNVMDWRNPRRGHDNIPPSTNIYVRYQRITPRAMDDASPRPWNSGGAFSMRDAVRHAPTRAPTTQLDGRSAAEPRYSSSMVQELDPYTSESLTPHDCILRMSLGDGGGVNLMRQGLQMLLDIFTHHADMDLSREDGTMAELLMAHLRKVLMEQSTFMQWYACKQRQLDGISGRMEEAHGLVHSVPPMNYIGRIVVSCTDATEQEVISHYGGKSWRRIENFLRGVRPYDPSSGIPGQSLGEEYVELRESNIPIHTHSGSVADISSSGPQEWMVKGKGGHVTRLMNAADGSESSASVGLKGDTMNYHVGDLKRQTNVPVAVPHDNMPPYLDVYVWECTGLTDEERALTQEPDDGMCEVAWLPGDGQQPIRWTRRVGDPLGRTPQGESQPPPSVSMDGHSFQGWKCPDGSVKPGDSAIMDTVVGNSLYIAQWKPSIHNVTFRCPGGVPQSMTIQRPHGQPVGCIPTLDRLPQGYGRVVAWRTSGGETVDAETRVMGDIECTAQCEPHTTPQFTVRFLDGDACIETRTVDGGATIGSFPSTSPREGHIFMGWFSHREGGSRVSVATQVNANMDLFAQWETETFTVSWNPNYDGGETIHTTRRYGEQLGELPRAVRLGYDQDGWWSDPEHGDMLDSSTTVRGDMECHAHWTPIQYEIRYSLGGGELPTGYPTTYTIESGEIHLVAPVRDGYGFTGWTGSNGAFRQMEVSIPHGSHGDREYTANWKAKQYALDFDRTDGNAVGSMPTQSLIWDSVQQLAANAFTNAATVSLDANGGIPPTPTQLTAYRRFIGWAKSVGGGAVYGDREMVKNVSADAHGGFHANATLYASWSSTFGAVTLPSVYRTGHTFSGWWMTPSDESSGQPSWSANGGFAPTSTNGTLYAHWSANQYTVQFDPTLGQTPVASAAVVFGQPYGSLPTPYGDGYDFEGWKLMDGVGTLTSSSIVAVPRDHTLYAQWRGNTMVLTLDPNGGTLPYEDDGRRVCRMGAPFGQIFPQVVNTGYSFAGWWSSLDGGESISESTIAPYSDMAAYAHWTGNQYTVSFDGGSPYASGTMSPQTMQYGTPTPLEPNGFTLTGHTFSGWALAPGGDVALSDGESVHGLATEYGANVTIYAKWTANSYTIAFDANSPDATGQMDAMPMTYGIPCALPANGFARPGYSFTGWATSYDGVKELDDQQMVSDMTPIDGGVVTLFAVWELDSQ